MGKDFKSFLDNQEDLLLKWKHNSFPEDDKFKPDLKTFELISHKMNEVCTLMRNFYELQDMKIRTGREDY